MINRIKVCYKQVTNLVKQEQALLILLVCLPCMLVTTYSMFVADYSGYLIAFILIILVLLCSFVVVANKQNSEYQIRTLSNLIESMIDGDYTLRGKLKTNPAFKELLFLINNLADALARHKIEARESKMLLERIMEQMDALVIAVDQQGIVVMANASAEKLLDNKKGNLLEKPLIKTAVGEKIMQASSGIIELDHQSFTGEYFLFKESFLSDGQQHQLFLLTNAERLLMEKERQAWQSLLRVLSHEMNNSLAPISAISQSMGKKIAKLNDEQQKASLAEGIAIINERADSLSDFIATYSQLSHLPKPQLTAVVLNEVVSKLTGLFPNTHIAIDDSCQQAVNVDKHQLEQMLINLLKNADEAMAELADKHIEVYCQTNAQELQLYIRDFGSGIANADNIFVPFYSTKKQGSGIGLALCRQIMFNHNGKISIQNNVNGEGCEVKLTFPF